MVLNEKSILNIIATGPLVFIPLVVIVTALLVVNVINIADTICQQYKDTKTLTPFHQKYPGRGKRHCHH